MTVGDRPNSSVPVPWISSTARRALGQIRFPRLLLDDRELVQSKATTLLRRQCQDRRNGGACRDIDDLIDGHLGLAEQLDQGQEVLAVLAEKLRQFSAVVLSLDRGVLSRLALCRL